MSRQRYGAVSAKIINHIRFGGNYDLGITGKRGSGKSYAALTLTTIVSRFFGHHFPLSFICPKCEATVDMNQKEVEGFHMNTRAWIREYRVICEKCRVKCSYHPIESNLHFRPVDFQMRLRKLKTQGELKAGMSFILDEAGIGASSQDWYEQGIKNLSKDMESWRKYSLFVCFTAPKSGNITKRIREMIYGYMTPNLPLHVKRYELDEGVISNIKKKKGMSSWIFVNTEDDFEWNPRSRRGQLKFCNIYSPPKHTIQAYEAAKDEYLDWLRERSIRQHHKKGGMDAMTVKEAVEDIKKKGIRYRDFMEIWVDYKPRGISQVKAKVIYSKLFSRRRRKKK